MVNLAAHPKSSSCWSTLQETDLSDVGSYYCSPSFCRPPSRKLAINTTRSLASIFSNSLCSFLETKNFFNNETSLCGLLNMFLFLWCCTNSSNKQPADTTCYFFLLSFWNPFPSRFIIRRVPRGDLARRWWEEPITMMKWHCYCTSSNSRKFVVDRPNTIIS